MYVSRWLRENLNRGKKPAGGKLEKQNTILIVLSVTLLPTHSDYKKKSTKNPSLHSNSRTVSIAFVLAGAVIVVVVDMQRHTYTFSRGLEPGLHIVMDVRFIQIE